MGRAYEVIYLAAKGNPDIDSNVNLKRTIEKYKGKQVPMDIINRAIDKAKGNDGTDYMEMTYEGFGPGQSTFIITTLTDNVNRTVAYVRELFNKIHKSLGVTNSVSYNYDFESLIGYEGDDGDEVMLALLDEGIEIIDLENEDGEVLITAKPSDVSAIKDCLEKLKPGIQLK